MCFKRIACFILCGSMLICSTACSKNPTDTSQYSVVTEYYYEYTDGDENNAQFSETASTKNNSSNKTSSKESASKNNSFEKTHYGSGESNISSTSSTNSKNNVSFDFNKIEHVNYSVVQDKIGCDTIYSITNVLTDKGTDILSSVTITCDTDGVLIDGAQICVPFNVRKTVDDITLKVTHIGSGIEYYFNIPFESWRLIFEDEFNGTELNTDVWNFRNSNYAYRKSQKYLHAWQKQAIFLDGNGYLISRVASAGYDPNGVPKYYTGGITTEDKFETTYGYFEISAKLYQATGMWGAFWLVTGDMGDKNAANDNSSVNGAEIDIFESIYVESYVNHAVHWDGYGDYTKSENIREEKMPELFDGNFHTFALSWSPDEYIFYVDGKITHRTTANGISNVPGYILITTECGDWGGDMTLKPGEYVDMVVDYVRVYQFP